MFYMMYNVIRYVAVLVVALCVVSFYYANIVLCTICIWTLALCCWVWDEFTESGNIWNLYIDIGLHTNLHTLVQVWLAMPRLVEDHSSSKSQRSFSSNTKSPKACTGFWLGETGSALDDAVAAVAAVAAASALLLQRFLYETRVVDGFGVGFGSLVT